MRVRILLLGFAGVIALLAGCGSSSQHTNGSSVSANASTTSRTPPSIKDTIALRTIPVVPCNGDIQGIPYKYTGPSKTRIRLSATDAAQLVSFNEQMLAPRGWRCDLLGGSNGDTLEAYNPTAGFFLSGIGEYRPQEAVSAYYATPGNHALDQACPYFPQAAALHKQLTYPCGYADPTPLGEAQTRRTPDELDFSDPPHITELGTGDPSGGRNRAIGLELFDAVYHRGSYEPYAATGTCTLAARDRHLCTAILSYVRSRYAAMMK
jgi:hypothetical protein